MCLLQPSDFGELLRTVILFAFAIKLILQACPNVLLRCSLMKLTCEYLLKNDMFVVVLTMFMEVNLLFVIS